MLKYIHSLFETCNHNVRVVARLLHSCEDVLFWVASWWVYKLTLWLNSIANFLNLLSKIRTELALACTAQSWIIFIHPEKSLSFAALKCLSVIDQHDERITWSVYNRTSTNAWVIKMGAVKMCVRDQTLSCSLHWSLFACFLSVLSTITNLHADYV